MTLTSQTSDTLVTNPAAQSQDAAGFATVTFTETVTNATVAQNGQQLTITRSGTAAGTGSINYTLTNPDGQNDSGVITVTVQAKSTSTVVAVPSSKRRLPVAITPDSRTRSRTPREIRWPPKKPIR